MSLIGQLSSKESEIPELLQKLYHDHAGGTVLPSVQSLLKVLLIVIPMQSSCYIVLDGIDECSKLEEMLEVINVLRRHGVLRSSETGVSQHLHILVTSRKLYEIEAALVEALPDAYTVFVAIDARADIERFIERKIERTFPKSQRFLESRREMSAALLDKSGGTFVHCILTKHYPY